MKKIFITVVIAGVLGVSAAHFLARAKAQTSTSSSIRVESNVSNEGSSNVFVKQSVNSSNKTVIHTFREKNGQVIENTRRVISQAGDVVDIDREELKQKIRTEANDEVEKETEAALDEFETELDRVQQETEVELQEAEEEIANEKEQARQELEDLEDELGTVEADLKEQLDEQLDEEELSFWERIRAWIDERIEQLS